MKLRLKDTPQNRELIQKMGSKNLTVAREAQEAFAAIINIVVEKILSKAGTASLIYRDLPYNEDDSPSFPIELWYNEDVNYVQVWYQTVAGGLPTSVVEGSAEMKFHTYRLDSSVAFYKKYARKANLDVMAKALEKMSQEVLVKQERNAWAVALKALAEASTNGLGHVIDATASDIFQVNDLNKLLTRARRINTAWDKGTPNGFDSKGVTDLFLSPEMKEQIRGFAYQPVNTRSGAVASSGATSIALPDNVREEIYRGAGLQEIYGVGITELLELGVNAKYNILFDTFTSLSFDPAADELIVGIDLSREGLIRPVARQSDSGGTFSAQVDDQYVARQDKAGYWGFLEEGRACVDSRVLVGIKV